MKLIVTFLVIPFLAGTNAFTLNLGGLLDPILGTGTNQPPPVTQPPPQSDPENDDPTKLYRGKVATSKQFPFMVSIQAHIDDGNGTPFIPQAHERATVIHICAGTILNPFTVLTAGHCLEKMGKSYADTIIVAGTKHLMDLPGYEQNRTAKWEKYHPQYSKYGPQNDIGLLFLDYNDKFEFNEYVNSVSLPPKGYKTPVGSGDVAQWDFDDERKNLSSVRILQKWATVPYLNDEVCGGLDTYFNRTTMFCADSIANETRWSVDSGGPIFSGLTPDKTSEEIEGIVVGLFSIWRPPLDDSGARPYTKVAEYLDWINKEISNHHELLKQREELLGK